MVARLKVGRLWSGSDEARIQTAGVRDVSGSLYQRPAVGEEGDDVVATLEAKQQIVGPDIAVRAELCFHFGEIHRPVMLVNLHRIAAAERDVWTAFPSQMGEITQLADFAVRAGMGSDDFRPFVCP